MIIEGKFSRLVRNKLIHYFRLQYHKYDLNLFSMKWHHWFLVPFYKIYKITYTTMNISTEIRYMIVGDKMFILSEKVK